ncbi:magnesium transporter MRS2-11, chloroplastic-like isoform X2 [Aristolochia californica]|uniref:magnesium transporter MRS2-11, chloroplastic-like isoform X2 n=1 Tax=Aristolochia californica TaxID=171875 RepID=UPI0035E01D14
MASVSHQSALNLLQRSPTPLHSPEPASFIFFFPERSYQVSPVSLLKTTHNHCVLPITVKAKGETKGELIDQPTEDSPPNSLRLNDSISLGIKEPIYEVIEMRSDGIMSTKKINRRQLLKSSGLRLRDIRTVDPSLWLTNSAPSLLVVALLEVLPNQLTANILEQLRISKQTLVELGSRVGALRQMLLDLLDDTDEIRHICIMGRNCTLLKGNDVECDVPLEKPIVEEEEEEIEMLLENYLQRCESCHGQAERLLDFAKEMEDSIVVNLSSRRLEVSQVELLLQVGTFCVSIGALVTGFHDV